MKKFFSCILLLLFVVAMQVVVQYRAGPSYQGEHIQCMITPEQPSTDLISVNTDALAAGCPVEQQGDIEKSSIGDFSYLSSRQCDFMPMYLQSNSGYRSLIEKTQDERSTLKNEGTMRLDIGELSASSDC